MEKLTAITFAIIALVVGMIFVTWPKEQNLCESGVKILSPHSYEYSCFEKDMPLVFEGTALSLDCVDMSNKIVWKSDIKGPLGIGKKIAATLNSGKHTITAYVDEDIKYSISVIVDKPLVRKQESPKKSYVVSLKDRDGAVFTVNRTTGTIIDTSTNLMWQRTPDTYQYTYNEAVAHVKSSKLAGYSDWRLPTKQELSDIHNIYNDGRDAILHDEFVTFEGKFWSCTQYQTFDGGMRRFIVEQKSSSPSRAALLSVASGSVDSAQLYIRMVRNNK